jgi:hypothetical protein
MNPTRTPFRPSGSDAGTSQFNQMPVRHYVPLLEFNLHRRRYHSCLRSFWNQWCAYGSVLKGSTSTNPALS